MKIDVNKQNSICINEEIYIDPIELNRIKPARFIFITHPHWDHFSEKDINKILTNDTVIICPKSMENEVVKYSNKKLFVEPNKTYKLNGLEFSTFRAYNTNKNFHLREYNWVGYDLFLDNNHIVIVGDSDITPELMKLKADVLLIPIGGTFTMNVDEAAKLTNLICPKMVIPTHYGEYVGNKNMGKQFENLIDKKIKCKILL